MSYTPVEQKLRTGIMANSGLAALVGTNVYSSQLPQSVMSAATVKALTIQRVGTARLKYATQDGINVLAPVRLRITAWCKGVDSHLDALAIFKALIAFLNTFSATGLSQQANRVLNERITVYAQTQPPLYQGVLETLVWNREDL